MKPLLALLFAGFWAQLALSQGFDSPTDYAKGIQNLLKTGKKVEARSLTDEGLRKYPTDYILLLKKVSFELEDSSYSSAMLHADAMLQTDPKYSEAWFIKGLVYQELGSEDSMVYYYQKAVELDGKNVKALSNLGSWYYNAAQVLLNQLHQLGSSAKEVKLAADLRKKIQALYAKAKPNFEKVVELEPENENTKHALKRVNQYLAE